MSDLGESLLAQIRELFQSRMKRDKELQRLANLVRDGTYEDAGDYAVRLGELLGQSINEATGTLAFMSKEVAQEVLEPVLRDDHDILAEVIKVVQKRLNDAHGLGLNPVIPEVDTNRIAGFIEKVASGEKLDDVRWMFGEPVVNYSQSVIDQAIRDNARATSKLGMKAYIVRTAEPDQVKRVTRGKKKVTYVIPCRWCKKLEGRYLYEDAPKDVYRRHESCRCRVTYEYGGSRQNVWTKMEWTDAEAAEKARKVREAEREMRRLRETAEERAKKQGD